MENVTQSFVLLKNRDTILGTTTGDSFKYVTQKTWMKNFVIIIIKKLNQ